MDSEEHKVILYQKEKEHKDRIKKAGPKKLEAQIQQKDAEYNNYNNDKEQVKFEIHPKIMKMVD